MRTGKQTVHNATHKNHPARTLIVILSSKLTELSGGSATQTAMLDILEQEGMLVRDSNGARTWGYFPKLAKIQYVVVDATGIEAPEETQAAPASKGISPPFQPRPDILQ